MSGGRHPFNLSSSNRSGGRRRRPRPQQSSDINENISYVKSVFNHSPLIDLYTVPPYTIPHEILLSEDKLYALFMIWMDETGRSYSSDREKLRRFEGFKQNVFRINDTNSGRTRPAACINQFADWLPSDPFPCSRLTEEETAEHERLRSRYADWQELEG